MIRGQARQCTHAPRPQRANERPSPSRARARALARCVLAEFKGQFGNRVFGEKLEFSRKTYF